MFDNQFLRKFLHQQLTFWEVRTGSTIKLSCSTISILNQQNTPKTPSRSCSWHRQLHNFWKCQRLMKPKRNVALYCIRFSSTRRSSSSFLSTIIHHPVPAELIGVYWFICASMIRSSTSTHRSWWTWKQPKSFMRSWKLACAVPMHSCSTSPALNKAIFTIAEFMFWSTRRIFAIIICEREMSPTLRLQIRSQLRANEVRFWLW